MKENGFAPFHRKPKGFNAPPLPPKTCSNPFRASNPKSMLQPKRPKSQG